MPKTPRPLPQLSVLIATFRYDPKIGRLFNRFSRTSRKAGEFADKSISNRYRVAYVDGGLYLAHRIIWYIGHGKDATDFIDHIDGDRLNNRLENLRLATHPMNMANRPKPPHNTSGAKGVHLRKDNGKWRAKITANRKNISLGQFSTFDEAHSAVKAARIRLHGVYAHDD